MCPISEAQNIMHAPNSPNARNTQLQKGIVTVALSLLAK